MSKTRLPLIVATFATALVLTASASAKTLIFCTDNLPEGFDPALHTSETSLDGSSLLYDRLVEWKPGDTEVTPGLAQSWSESEDGLEHTFNLRSSVRFQKRKWFEPSRDFNAEDVVFTFERQLKKDNPWYRYAKGYKWEYFDALSLGDLIKNVEKVDDSTVKFVLRKADPTFLSKLTLDFASIVSKEYADNIMEDEEVEMETFNSKPVGTGPYMFVNHEDDLIVRYRIHKQYWDGEKQMHTIFTIKFPDPEERLILMQGNQCHALAYPNLDDLEEIRNDENLTLHETEESSIGYLAYNTRVAPLDNPAVRKALNMAINKQAILDEIFKGEGQIAKNPIPPSMWSYNEDIEDDGYNPEAARAMLEVEGVNDFTMKVFIGQYQGKYREIAEMIKADFAEVGVEVDIVDFESYSEMYKHTEEGDADSEAMETADSGSENTDKDSSSATEAENDAGAESDSEADDPNATDSTEENADGSSGDSETEEESEPEVPIMTIEEKLANYKFDETVGAFLLEWEDKNGDPDNFLGFLLSCNAIGGFNHAQWCNKEFDEQVNAARELTEQEERTEKYLKAQEIFKNEAPWATLVHTKFHVPMSNQIVDYEIDPRGKFSFIDTNFYEEPEPEEEEESEEETVEGESDAAEVIEVDVSGDDSSAEIEETESADSVTISGDSTEVDSNEASGESDVETEAAGDTGEDSSTEAETAENSDNVDAAGTLDSNNTENDSESANNQSNETNSEDNSGSTDSESGAEISDSESADDSESDSNEESTETAGPNQSDGNGNQSEESDQ